MHAEENLDEIIAGLEVSARKSLTQLAQQACVSVIKCNKTPAFIIDIRYNTEFCEVVPLQCTAWRNRPHTHSVKERSFHHFHMSILRTISLLH